MENVFKPDFPFLVHPNNLDRFWLLKRSQEFPFLLVSADKEAQDKDIASYLQPGMILVHDYDSWWIVESENAFWEFYYESFLGTLLKGGWLIDLSMDGNFVVGFRSEDGALDYYSFHISPESNYDLVEEAYDKLKPYDKLNLPSRRKK